MNFHKLFIVSFLTIATLGQGIQAMPSSELAGNQLEQILKQVHTLTEKARDAQTEKVRDAQGELTQKDAMDLLHIARQVRTAIDNNLLDLTGERYVEGQEMTPSQEFGMSLRVNARAFASYNPSIAGFFSIAGFLSYLPFTKPFRLNSMVKELLTKLYSVGRLIENRILLHDLKYPLVEFPGQVCDPESQSYSYKDFIRSSLQKTLEPYEDLH